MAGGFKRRKRQSSEGLDDQRGTVQQRALNTVHSDRHWMKRTGWNLINLSDFTLERTIPSNASQVTLTKFNSRNPTRLEVWRVLFPLRQTLVQRRWDGRKKDQWNALDAQRQSQQKLRYFFAEAARIRIYGLNSAAETSQGKVIYFWNADRSTFKGWLEQCGKCRCSGIASRSKATQGPILMAFVRRTSPMERLRQRLQILRPFQQILRKLFLEVSPLWHPRRRERHRWLPTSYRFVLLRN